MIVKVTVNSERTMDIKELHVGAGVRHYEDATVNGVEDVDGTLMPCMDTNHRRWYPIIDVETGIIKNWKAGTTADVHYKVCDDCQLTLVDSKGDITHEGEGYVPECLCPAENGYGDYVIMRIDETGKIEGWEFSTDDIFDEED